MVLSSGVKREEGHLMRVRQKGVGEGEECECVCVCGTTVREEAALAPTQLCHISRRLGAHTSARKRLLQRCTCPPRALTPHLCVQTEKNTHKFSILF